MLVIIVSGAEVLFFPLSEGGYWPKTGNRGAQRVAVSRVGSKGFQEHSVPQSSTRTFCSEDHIQEQSGHHTKKTSL